MVSRSARTTGGGAQGAPRKHASGFVSILGLPNAGKSTLMNSLVGSKVAIVSSKPQTTRTSIQAVLTRPDAQIVFADTPGVHEAGKLIHRRMMARVREALSQRDLLLWVCDSTAGPTRAGLDGLEILAGRSEPRFLVLNKIDRLRDKQQLLPVIEAVRARCEFQEYVPVSSLTGEGLDTLLRLVVDVLPEGPRFFPADYVTDQPERFLAAEMIREQALEITRQEVPHAVAVLVEQWEETPRLLRIRAAIHVEREGQKRILIGEGGSMVKRIGIEARREIEGFLGRPVHLELFVKVSPDWRNNPAFLNELDWRYMASGETS